MPTATDSDPAARVYARLDERGGPVAGARLSSRSEGPTALSAASGEAELVIDAALFGGRAKVQFTFEVTCPGYAEERQEAEWNPGESGWLPDWTLSHGGRVAGVVLDEHGMGLAGARVACLDESVHSGEPDRRARATLEQLWKPGAETETGSDGSFQLEAVPAGQIRLIAAAKLRPIATSRVCDVPVGEP